MAGNIEVATITPTSAEQLELVRKVIMGEAELPIADPAAISRAIMERILASTTLEEIGTQQNLTPWRSMLGRVVKMTDVRFNRSSVKGGEGPGLYAVVDLVDVESGEAITVTCGGQNVLAQLYALLANGLFGKGTWQMIENTTAEGYGALWLEVVDADA